jgi:glycosyltransferase involved in cell wall biosynthesis
MYDKTLFEAASCECAVVASSKDFAELVGSKFIFEDGHAEDLAQKLQMLLTMPVLDQQGAGAQMRNSVREHSLARLMQKLVVEMQ